MELFNPNGKLFSLLSRICDLAYVNFLFLITSLPIVTIGAALTALNRVTQEIVTDELGSVTDCYFRNFKSNFGKATGLWLLLLTGLILLAGDWLLLRNVLNLPGVFEWITLIVLVVLLAVIFYSFQLLARFENTAIATLRNSLLLSLGHLPFTLLFLIVPALAVGLILFLTPTHASVFSFFLIFFGASLHSLLCSAVMLRKVFPKHHTAD